ncbi:MAG: BatA domain-containing protein, partial [Phycisphaerales bacterium]
MLALGAITGLSIGWAIGAGALALAPLIVHLLARGRARRIVFPGQRFLAEVAARGRRASRPRDAAPHALRAAARASLGLA